MKRLKRYGRIILFLVLFIIGLLLVYSINPHKAEESMFDLLDDIDVTATEDFDEITYEVTNPKANIIIIPGGKVKAEAYMYLAANLAEEGYNVTIYKPVLNLSILSGNYAKKFIDSELDNIIIGHSLGGVTASMIANKESEIDKVVLLGSYATKDISNKDVLSITAEHDLVMNQENYEDNLQYLGDVTEYEISGGNHAQFGFYLEQSKDGEATISLLEQQDEIVLTILSFIRD